MFNGDPNIQSNALTIDLSLLGLEAKSILKSIRTEHSKLCQSRNLAQSDLHYFRARYNYYRLSLMRLSTEERETLDPVLSKFRSQIVEFEGCLQGGTEPPTPFLSPIDGGPSVREKQPEPPVEVVDEIKEENTAEAVIQESLPKLEMPQRAEVPEGQRSQIIDELSLVKIALEAPASSDRNLTISRAVERVIETIRKS